ncbi:nitrilotriacetate monooxygenase [Paraburkholderia ginsengiterrae]|uniref:Nitrilotriacetate monooxygenase n=1 Tax=Paraburkholderia ginsengiterrae TaxID=1462993 RepID=A0A1A9N691_9BURK|nr:flavin reductase family protein [Paraburkholderia ginsengiterrae]OAJ59218.1 nitrilotriacetate monooxygenase [Paraburkholderia ginsengiterrae]OAJ60160.1 nitrilotriacetate monooxygenase [Paraburkholderia ginsengiterrae]
MIVDPSTQDAAANYKLLIGSILPRAIAWVSTLSRDGVANLAPISFFTVVGRKPPMLSISMQPRADGVTLKDTFVNIRDTGEFVVNIVNLELADAMHRTAFDFPPDVDEFEAVGLDKAESQTVRPPRVKAAPIAFECKLERIIPIGDQNDHVVFGEVLRYQIRDDLYLDRGRIDTAGLQAVGRLAAEYTVVQNAFTTPLDPQVLALQQNRRLGRLDGFEDGYSPIDTNNWSASGATR